MVREVWRREFVLQAPKLARAMPPCPELKAVRVCRVAVRASHPGALADQMFQRSPTSIVRCLTGIVLFVCMEGGTGVGLVVHAHQLGQGDMGVALGCGQLGVSEQFLHGTQIRAAFQQVCGKGMAETVRGNMLGEMNLLASGLQNSGGLPAIEAFALFLGQIHKDRACCSIYCSRP